MVAPWNHIRANFTTSANRPPAIATPAWAGPNPVILPNGATVHVVASDPDSDALTYAWSKLSGAGTATFGAPTAADSGVTFSSPGTYVLRVTIGDGKGASVTSDVTIAVNVTGNQPPVANAQSVSTAEDTAKAITLVGTDAENSALYSAQCRWMLGRDVVDARDVRLFEDDEQARAMCSVGVSEPRAFKAAYMAAVERVRRHARSR